MADDGDYDDGDDGDFDDVDEGLDEVQDGQTEEERIDLLQQEEVGKAVPDEERSTTPFMTKYERARVLGKTIFKSSKVIECREFKQVLII